MLILVHNSPSSLEKYRHPNLGVLSSPRRFYKETEGVTRWPWAADNDAFSKWDADKYRRMLDAIQPIPGCLFVTAPDVVGDAAATLSQFHEWKPTLQAVGQPVALVSQDGLDDPPWDEFDALFVGGTSQWKLGEPSAELVREAKRRGKWVHMGRVNSFRRVTYAKALGCDSIDGTQFSWWKDAHLMRFLAHAAGPTQLMLDAPRRGCG